MPPSERPSISHETHMTPAKSDDIHNPYLPNPWDDPDDTIDWVFWLQAVDEDRMPVIAQYLSQPGPHDRRVLRAFADKLDPSDRRQSRYLLRKRNGRPAKLSTITDDKALDIAMKAGELISIASHLRFASTPDRSVLDWLTIHLAPERSDDPHFIIVKPKGRSPKQSYWAERLLGKNYDTEMFGFKVDLKFRGDGKLEAALQHFMTRSKANPRPVSRSKALRAHQAFVKTRSRKLKS
jgi:hypothetical protein